MADQTLVFWHGDAGRTDLTLDLVHPTTFAVVASGLALSDDPSGGLTIRQRYIHTRVGVTTAGRHIARVYEGGVLGPNSPHIVDLANVSGSYKLGWAGTLDWLADFLPGMGLSTLDATGIRAAVGLATANTDAQLAALAASIALRLLAASYTAPDNAGIAAILGQTGTSGVALTAAERNAIADASWGRANVVAGKTPAEALRIIGATTAGAPLTGAGTTQEVFCDFAGVICVTMTTPDDDGNRTGAVYS